MATPSIQSAYVGLPAVQPIPTNMRARGVMSTTSDASDCFIGQRFSNKLQAFMISYVNVVYSNYPIYAV